MRFLLFCLFLLVIAAWASAAEPGCQPVDLRGRLGPPLHQGDTGFCFAHAAADLIGLKTGRRVSPMQLGTSFVLANPQELQGKVGREVARRITPEFLRRWRLDRSDEPENFLPARILTMEGILFTGGEEEAAILLANFLGLCPEERLPSGRDAFPLYLDAIRSYHEARRRAGAIPPGERAGPIGEVRDPEARAMAWSFRHWVEGRCGPALRPRQALLPESVRYGRTLADFLSRAAGGGLDPRLARATLLRAIDGALDRGRAVSVGYSTNDIMPRDPRVPDGDHVSVLAARRRIGGECFYFLRNSFGEARPEDYREPFRGRLERGGVWVRAVELPSLYSALWLR